MEAPLPCQRRAPSLPLLECSLCLLSAHNGCCSVARSVAVAVAPICALRSARARPCAVSELDRWLNYEAASVPGTAWYAHAPHVHAHTILPKAISQITRLAGAKVRSQLHVLSI